MGKKETFSSTDIIFIKVLQLGIFSWGRANIKTFKNCQFYDGINRWLRIFFVEHGITKVSEEKYKSLAENVKV